MLGKTTEKKFIGFTQLNYGHWFHIICLGSQYPTRSHSFCAIVLC